MKPTKNNKPYTIITGASSGLGKEFAIEYARQNRNLILIALPGRNLKQLCEELERLYGIRALYYESDLTDQTALSELARLIKNTYSVNQLINNAGIGGTKRFTDASVEYLDKIIQLNIKATTMLTHLMLPELLLHKKALILNVASMAAFGPIPYKTIYPASKAFIYSFTRSLSEELRGTGVRVVVVNPGQIVTNPDVTLRIIRQGTMAKFGLLTAGKITRVTISALARGKEVIIPGFINKLNRLLLKWVPEYLRLSLLKRAIGKELTMGEL
jgi:hypothetical protein